MVKKKDEIPGWVSAEIQSAEFGEPQEESRTGYILDIYEQDGKMDVQLYEPVEDGRHIVTVDLADDIRTSDLQKGTVYSFRIGQLKAPLSDKVVEYLHNEQGLDMNAIYQFQLRSLEAIDKSSGAE